IHRKSGTPGIDRLLERLARRLRAHVLLFGLGRVLLGGAAWLALAFVLDRWLQLPGGVRVVHFAVLLGLPAWLLWRELLVPLRRIPDRDGLAVLVEREHPELHELLVSAVQLERRAGASTPGEAELVRRVVADAESRARLLDPAGIDDPVRSRKSLLGGALA